MMKKTNSKRTPGYRTLRSVRQVVLRRTSAHRSPKRRQATPDATLAPVLELPTVVAMMTQVVTPPAGPGVAAEVTVVASVAAPTADEPGMPVIEDPFASADVTEVASQAEPLVVRADAQPGLEDAAAMLMVEPEADGEVNGQAAATRELFDAQGNLLVFSPSSADALAVDPVAVVEPSAWVPPQPAPPSPIPPPEPAAVAAAAEPTPTWVAVAVDEAGDAADAGVVMAQQLRAVPKLTLVGALRVVAWPVLKLGDLLTWPVRALWLGWQRRQLRREYGRPVEPTPELVESGRVVRLWWMTLPSHWPRVILRFIAISMVLILPLQVAVYYQSVGNVREGVVAQTNAAIAAMRQTRQLLAEQRFREAIAKFAQAEAGLHEVREQFSRLDVVTKRLINAIPQERQMMTLGMALLSAGEGIARVGQDLGAAAEQLQTAQVQGEWSTLNDVISELRDSLAFAVPQVAAAQTELAAADVSGLPSDAAPAIASVRTLLPEAEGSLRLLQVVTDSLYTVLGLGEWQRYLVVFQNSNELRATGGFLGSYALMDVADGKIVRLEIPGGGLYDLEGASQVRVLAPAPLRLLRSEWQIWDANWWPDFPTSAQKLAELYERSRGPSVDGVIAVNAHFLERLLAVVGPVEMATYGMTVTADNVIVETQRQVELLYDRERNRPKQFIADLAAQLLPRLTAPAVGQQEALLAALTEGLQRRELQVYSRHAPVQALISQLGASGELMPTGDDDYLAVIVTNIAGAKTDGVIRQRLHQLIEIAQDGSVINTLTLTRAHQGVAGEPFTGVTNNSYLRFYVPEGSELLEAEGFAHPKGAAAEAPAPDLREDLTFASVEGAHEVDAVSGVEIWREASKTVFAHWLSVAPGEERQVRLRYRLPRPLRQDPHVWRLVVQAQSGRRGDSIDITVRRPADWQVQERFPATGTVDGSLIQFSSGLDRDAFFGLTFTPS